MDCIEYSGGVVEPGMVESGEVSRLLIEIGERAKADFGAAAAPLGIPVPLARAILLLEHPITMRALADALSYDPSYVTGLADQLEERDLGRRVAGRDRRVKLLELTPDGVALRDRLEESVARRAAVVHRLAPARRAELRDLLQELVTLQDAD